MAQDRNGDELRVGDRVTVECEVVAVWPWEEWHNVEVRAVEAMHPGDEYRQQLHMNGRQVVKVLAVLIPCPMRDRGFRVVPPHSEG